MAAERWTAEAHAELHTPDDWVSTLHRGDRKLWAEYLVDERPLDPPRHWVVDPRAEDAALLADPARLPTAESLFARLEDLRAGWAAAPDRSGRTALSRDDLAGLKAMGYVDD